MTRLALACAILLGLLAALTAAPIASADSYPLTVGERGAKVCKAKYLLSRKKMVSPRRGHTVKTLRGRHVRKTGCTYTLITGKATRKAYYKLGWPAAWIKSSASLRYGPRLHLILQGKQARPLSYIREAARRAKLRADSTPAAWAQRMVSLAFRQCCGFRETWGRNRGPLVQSYQAITGTYGLAWCVSFVQWLRVSTGLRTVANRTAGVAYLTEYGRARGWLRARPEPGYLAAFGSQHVTLVVRVVSNGYYSVGGNESDGVRHRFHYTWQRPTAVFIRADAYAH